MGWHRGDSPWFLRTTVSLYVSNSFLITLFNSWNVLLETRNPWVLIRIGLCALWSNWFYQVTCEINCSLEWHFHNTKSLATKRGTLLHTLTKNSQWCNCFEKSVVNASLLIESIEEGRKKIGFIICRHESNGLKHYHIYRKKKTLVYPVYMPYVCVCIFNTVSYINSMHVEWTTYIFERIQIKQQHNKEKKINIIVGRKKEQINAF